MNDEYYEKLAYVGYTAYGDKAGWKAYNGEAMPGWTALPAHIRERWVAAAAAIFDKAMEDV